MVFSVEGCTAWGKKGRIAFFFFNVPPVWKFLFLFFFFFPPLHSIVRFLVCALCNTAVLATSAEQRFCDSERSNRLYVAFVTKK